MLSESTTDHLPLTERVARFASEEVACRADRFNSKEAFPLDIWRRMGEEGLLALNLPPSLGGLGCDPPGVVAAIETFVRHGRSIGLAFSWLIHLILSRYFIMEFGKEEQRIEYLPKLAVGQVTASLAISEPGVGAHPKHLKTVALDDGKGCFILNGEKSFLTNGPIADLFIIFAVTSERAGRKGFSAFLVEKGTLGLSLTPEFDLGCLYPSPHCGMRLENCRIPASSVLGEKHSAYERMAKPFRLLEDIYMTGLVLGGMEMQLAILLSHMRKKSVPYADEVKSGLGELRILLNSFRVVVREIARLLGDENMESPELLSLVLSFRHWSNHYQSRFEPFRRGLDKAESTLLDDLTRDLVRIGGIAGSIVSIQQKRLGESLLSGKESDAEFR